MLASSCELLVSLFVVPTRLSFLPADNFHSYFFLLPYLPFAGLKTTIKRTAPLLACVWAADSWLFFEIQQGGSFRMCHFIPGNFLPTEIPPLFSNLQIAFFLVGVRFLILFQLLNTLFHFFPPPYELSHFHSTTSKKQLFFFPSHIRPRSDARKRIWGKFSSPPKK